MEVIQSNAPRADAAFLEASRSGLQRGLAKIRHCVDQLDDQQIWQRPRPEMNSIANLLLHLSGNLRQWIVSGVGGSRDVRDRPAEFADRSAKSKAELLSGLSDIISQCEEVLSHVEASALVQTRRIQGFDIQLLAAIYDAVAHLQGHVQEIIHMTRFIKGEAYRFDFVPQGKAQGGSD